MRLACCRVALLALALFGAARCADRSPAASGAARPAASPAAIESHSGENCAAKLSPDANAIYWVAAPDMHHDTDLASLLREKVMSMVVSGQLQRSAARPAAEQAAACLQLLF